MGMWLHGRWGFMDFCGKSLINIVLGLGNNIGGTSGAVV